VAFFPNNINSEFAFTSDVGLFITSLVVEGQSSIPPTPPTSSSRVITATGTSRPATGGPIVPLGGRKCSSVNVKIVQALFKRSPSGRVEFKPVSQCFIDVNESTANVMYLNHAIKEKWGSEYTLVSSDGLRIEDSSGTQGMCAEYIYSSLELLSKLACAHYA